MTNEQLLAMVARLRAGLSPRQREALRLMYEAEKRDDLEDAELVYERGQAWVGLEQFGRRTLFALLRAMAIKRNDTEGGGVERYGLTPEGREVVQEPTP